MDSACGLRLRRGRPMPDIQIIAPDAAPIKADALAFVSGALVKVQDRDSHGRALEVIRECRRRCKAIMTAFEPTRSSLDKAKKDLLALRDGILAPLEALDREENEEVSRYEREAERRAEDERRRLEVLARKAIEEAKLEAAIYAEQTGDYGSVEEILNEPSFVPILHVEPQTAKVEGVSSRELWSAEVTDKAALVRFVAANPMWMHLLEPNMVAINGLARSQRGALAIPGVRAVSATSRAVRVG